MMPMCAIDAGISIISCSAIAIKSNLKSLNADKNQKNENEQEFEIHSNR